ncbi:undecaprenyl-diphosphatase [Paenibacillus sp. GCM10028914]|uniref:undecaprenyl-diphosphatase n=1 Tax=Paenibacillus sp. GCM10028914 TaxID=3273416 RepID=UPI00362296A8
MDISKINVELFRFINDIGKEYAFLNSTFIFLAEYMVYILALLTILFWFSRKLSNRMMVISAMISFMLAEILGKIAGQLHSNKQPFVELPHVNQLIEKTVNNSFPSDHTILFFSFCVTFCIFHKRWRYIWISLAFLVGLSRVWVGVHYPADVIVGALISTVCAYFIAIMVPRLPILKKRLLE